MSREIICSEFIVRSLRLLLTRHPSHLAALNGLLQRPEGVSVEEFDRLNEPNGPQIRLDLAPIMIRVSADHVTITAVGAFAAMDADQPPWNAEP